MVKRHTRHKKRNMKGGAFTQGEIQELRERGFTANQIESLQDLGVSINDIMQKVNIILNQDSHVDPDYMTEQVMVELLNENIFGNATNQIDAIPHAADDIHDIDMDESFDSQGTMNLNELNISNRSRDSGYTTSEDISFDEFGGKRRRRTSRKNHRNKRRRTRRNSSRNVTLKGGMCFGRGVGANSYDPNYSIYNTNMLNLFPYKA
jgi:hypothetical protein